MKKSILLLGLLISGAVSAQSLNDYKYVIVPEKFGWQKENNSYNINSLTKMLFEKVGYEVYYQTEKLPDELALDRCKALYADIQNESNLLTTGLVINLKDCSGKTLFASIKGTSKEKAYQRAYTQALREAAQSYNTISYTYSGKNGASAAKPAVKQTASVAPATPVTVDNTNQLFAQPIANGYQLVDSAPKVVLKIFKTSQQDSFTAVSENKNGVVFKKGNDWIFEYYQNDQLVSEKLNIKF